jgi:hypothetical protein
MKFVPGFLLTPNFQALILDLQECQMTTWVESIRPTIFEVYSKKFNNLIPSDLLGTEMIYLVASFRTK